MPLRIWPDTKTVDAEFSDLGTLGHSGTLNDRIYSYLGDAGFTGSLSDRLASWTGGGDVFIIPPHTDLVAGNSNSAPSMCVISGSSSTTPDTTYIAQGA